MLFSHRIGKKATSKPIQLASMDEDLRNALWSILYEKHLRMYKDPRLSPSFGDPPLRGSNLERFAKRIWRDILRRPTDTIPRSVYVCIQQIREHYFSCDWNEAYDILEISVNTFPIEKGNIHVLGIYVASINRILEKESSGYRFVGKEVVPVSSDVEVRALARAYSLPRKFESVEDHFQKALSLFRSKKSPDYPNAVKEAICSIEALARIATGDEKASLGQLASKLEVHPALGHALSKMYGFTSDHGGIRHSTIEPTDVDYELAKYFLVTTSAFIHYVISKS